MKECKPVTISNGSFNFCKYTIAISLWISLFFQNIVLLIAVFLILLASAVLKVKNAPLVFLYRNTVDRIFKTKNVVLDESAVWFAHVVGAIFSAIAIGLIYLVNPLAGWITTGILAVLKTSGAMGFCGAMKLYGCLSNPNGQCCRTGKKIKSFKGKGC